VALFSYIQAHRDDLSASNSGAPKYLTYRLRPSAPSALEPAAGTN